MVDSLDGPLNGTIVLCEVRMVGEMGGQGHLLGNLPHRETLQRNIIILSQTKNEKDLVLPCSSSEQSGRGQTGWHPYTLDKS